MEFFFRYPEDFVSEEMAIAFLRSKKLLIKEGSTVETVSINTHRNRKDFPMLITFQVWYEGGGTFHYIPFIEYFTWFEENKFKYLR